MLTYAYDGTLEGLFSAFETALLRGEEPDGFSGAGAGTMELFGAPAEIPANPKLAAAFAVRLRAVDNDLPGHAIQVFMAEAAGTEMLIFRYYLQARNTGRSPADNLADPLVRQFQALARQVGRETHRFKGLLRFEELPGGLLWASYEPKHNITALLAPHFIARQPNEQWVICDVGRGCAVHWDRRRLQPAEIAPEALASLRRRGQLPGRHAGSDDYADLWRRYFARIAIQERKNPRLQRQFMPKEFWKWLPEKSPAANQRHGNG